MRQFWSRAVIFCGTLLPVLTYAQSADQVEGFVPLIGIPGLDPNGLTIGGYINTLYILAISVAAFLAVGMLLLAGFKYMLSDVVTQKEDAKKDIQGAIVGLLIVVGAVLILETINPQLRDLRILNLQSVNQPPLAPRANAIPDNPDNRGLDTENVEGLSEAEREVLRVACEEPTDGSTPGVYRTFGDGQGRCIGNETIASEDNVVNTRDVVDDYFAENEIPEDEQTTFRQRFNQFIGAQEPSNLTPEDIINIEEEFDAEEVLFVVNDPLGLDASLVGYESSQEAICSELGAFYTTTDSTPYRACIR
jgi:hypothetical protein